MQNKKGKIYLVLSAVMYAFIPVLARFVYHGGANGMTLAFLQAALAVPLLLFILRANHISLKLTRAQVRHVLILSLLGGAVPLVCLAGAYRFIAMDFASSLHFIYPLTVVLSCVFFQPEKITTKQMLAAIFVTLGVFLFMNIQSASNKAGIVLALLSGVFYGFYIFYMNRSGLDGMQYFKLTFYVSCITSGFVFLAGMMFGSISFHLTPGAWGYAFLIAGILSLGAIPLLQAGIRYEGAASAGIFSAIQPVASIVLAAVLFGEDVGTFQMIGMLLIVAGVFLGRRPGGKNVSG